MTPRQNLDFGLAGDIPRFWFGGDTFRTRLVALAVLEHSELFATADRRIFALYAWHCAGEFEHKAVFQPGFHPARQGKASGDDRWLETYERTGDPISAVAAIGAGGPARY